MKKASTLPLFERLVQHDRGGPISCHVPGHKQGALFHKDACSYFQSILSLDVTELTGLDDLHDPEGVIAEAQALTARYVGAEATCFLVNGSTVGNLAMILGTLEPGDTVFVQRDSHKSVMNGLAMARVHPIFLSPAYDERTQLPTGITEQTLKQALIEHPNGKALILTYPSYYGVARSIRPLVQMAKEAGLYVLVDEAHGAHFPVGDPFPKQALEQGADVVVQSAHKTLPALTMGSYLHFAHGLHSKIKDSIREQLQILQSSSPSYPILASLDAARGFLEDLTNVKDTLDSIAEINRRIEQVERLSVATFSPLPTDPLKTVITVEGATGFALQTELEKEGIYSELADDRHVLLMWGLTPLQKVRQEEIIDKMCRATKRLPAHEQISKACPLSLSWQAHTSLDLSYDEQKRYSIEEVAVEEAVGKVSGATVIPYPPGVPLLLKGEKITEPLIAQFQQLQEAGARFQGRPSEQQGLYVFTLEAMT
ncbi:aminotransferase class I/II-fold pyridoxal phosphate-dependent enzyme [Halalkalibacterium halodurans]|jgi:arginine/lysine/ornithine decarboxylase|uniref:Arginine/lysine/ornithine decarboxylase n=1 Tax=Halalkalibacterium halodurans TaxID=86665 RepID=A0A0M0KCM2_ALKHA|nr:aminotransferase class I/II-fold pyridoxal phosphate-dependent enzyme [Halalkalibacterium halodurans]MED3645614.1 aminotransferase class I/II-fold pyridoxal phosphate-dependent enzyme [Halalkalibacterium halodurans]TPE68534.1 aminotransferase class I/II-fold pyridoxal phosphate-dependent enzyme [Halalkalibacterium halodurans]